jgi:hypothetical protein
MLTPFPSVHGAIFIDWFPAGEKFNSGYCCEEIHDPLSQVWHDGRGAGFSRPIAHFDNTAPHRSAVSEIVSRITNSDTIPNLLIALIPVPGTSFYSVI